MGNPLDDIRRAMDSLADAPPLPFFASFKMLPADHAISFTHDGRQHVGAHPAFWARIPASVTGSGLWEVRIHDLDADREQRIAFLNAMGAAMEHPA